MVTFFSIWVSWSIGSILLHILFYLFSDHVQQYRTLGDNIQVLCSLDLRHLIGRDGYFDLSGACDLGQSFGEQAAISLLNLVTQAGTPKPSHYTVNV